MAIQRLLLLIFFTFYNPLSIIHCIPKGKTKIYLFQVVPLILSDS